MGWKLKQNFKTQVVVLIYRSVNLVLGTSFLSLSLSLSGSQIAASVTQGYVISLINHYGNLFLEMDHIDSFT